MLDTDKAKHPPAPPISEAVIEKTARKVFDTEKAKQPPVPTITKP